MFIFRLLGDLGVEEVVFRRLAIGVEGLLTEPSGRSSFIPLAFLTERGVSGSAAISSDVVKDRLDLCGVLSCIKATDGGTRGMA